MTTPLSLKDVVLISDMDLMAAEFVNHFEMKQYWDHRHVNQAIRKKFLKHHSIGIIFSKIDLIRSSGDRVTAEEQVAELKKILTSKTRKVRGTDTEVDNPYFFQEGWDYLSKFILKDLDKICNWTVAHLPNFWKWSQAVESRHNKDLNIWNQGQ